MTTTSLSLMMARSGLQKEVLSLYRTGVRNAFTKSPAERHNFLMHLRYNFRNPPLTPRDVGAIEYQLRRFKRTLEMLSEPSVNHIGVSQDMRDWWANEVLRAHARSARASKAK